MDLTQREQMQEKQKIVLDFLSKWGAFGVYLLIGLIGKFGFDIVTGKRLSFVYVFGSGCVAIFVGWIAWIWCQRVPALNPGLVVPIATLISRDVMLFITMVDYMGVLKLITRKDTKKAKSND